MYMYMLQITIGDCVLVAVILEEICVGICCLRKLMDVQVHDWTDSACIHCPRAFELEWCTKDFVQVVAKGANVTLLLHACLRTELAVMTVICTTSYSTYCLLQDAAALCRVLGSPL